MPKTTKTIREKLAYIQQELKAPKSQYNSFGGYNYRNAEDILEAVKPLLKETRTVINLCDYIVNKGQRYYVKAKAILLDLDSSSEMVVTAYAREEDNKKGMDGSQITGAASSYARKYALNGLLAIDDTKDSDTTNTHDKAKKVASTELVRENVSSGVKTTNTDSRMKKAPKFTEADGNKFCGYCNQPLKVSKNGNDYCPCWYQG